MKNKVAIFKEDYKPNLKKIKKAILKIQTCAFSSSFHTTEKNCSKLSGSASIRQIAWKNQLKNWCEGGLSIVNSPTKRINVQRVIKQKATTHRKQNTLIEQSPYYYVHLIEV